MGVRRTAVIGAGPTGLVLGMALARRGDEVTVVDRDAGPRPDGTWPRKGVMQFHHAHAFRPQVAKLLSDEAPSAWDRWVAAGAEPVDASTAAGAGRTTVGIRSRRMTFETALRAAALDTRGLRLLLGRVDEVTQARGRVSGIRLDGSQLEADLVIDASGRSSRVTRQLRTAPALGGDCGIAYVDRRFRLRPGVETPPLLNPLAWQGSYDGYLVIVFLHEHGIFSCIVVRSTADRALVPLGHTAAFEAACAAIAGLAAWTAPEVAVRLTDVLAGGPLLNVYRSQRRDDGRLALPGLLSVGDAVCTTTPIFGRGVTTSYLQVGALLRLLDAAGPDGDLESVGEAFDAWCETNMRPWVEDHIAIDGAQRRRWEGEDTYLDEKLPSDHVMEAAQQDPRIAPAIGPYLTMSALPSSLDQVAPFAKEVYAAGWRPPLTPGPSGAELAQIVADAAGLPSTSNV